MDRFRFALFLQIPRDVMVLFRWLLKPLCAGDCLRQIDGNLLQEQIKRFQCAIAHFFLVKKSIGGKPAIFRRIGLTVAVVLIHFFSITHSAIAADPPTVAPTSGRLEYYGTPGGYLCKLSGSPVGTDKYAVALASARIWGTNPQGAFHQGDGTYDGKKYSYYYLHIPPVWPFTNIYVIDQYICPAGTEGSPAYNCPVILNSRNNPNECCPCGYRYDSTNRTCVLNPAGRASCPAASRTSPKNLGPSVSGASASCSGSTTTPVTPNPISIGTGNKYLIEAIYVGSSHSPLTFSMVYNSADTGLSSQWRGLTIDRSVSVAPNGLSVTVFRGNGKRFVFNKRGTDWSTDADVTDKLTQLVDTNGGTTGWRYVNGDDELEMYGASGRLSSIVDRRGVTQSITYSDGTAGPDGGYVLDTDGNPTATVLPAGRVIRMTDAFGRTLYFGWDSGNLISVTDPSNQRYLFRFNGENNLTSIAYPDGKIKQYRYNESAYTSGSNLPHALTGIIDENGVRYATYHYDSNGRAVKEEHAPELALGINQYQLTYTTDGSANPVSTIVTDPLGTQRGYNFQSILDLVKSTGQSQPGGAGCGPSASSITYDANGNIASRTDFNGVQTTYAYDLARNLETRQVEAAGTPEARTISTEWHPTYRLPTKIAEPKRLTTNTYDDKGNLLSKTVQATSDASGAQGFSAAAVGTPRSWRYTYNQYGQVLTATGPRTDVDDTTRYAYDEQGNLSTITNAAGQVTTLSQYDANGRVGKLTDPNGLVTELTYAPRGWLTSKTVGGEVTNYEYDGVGQLKKVTQPDGAYVTYTYDDAHRLTAIADSLGNRISYTLDAMGNRVKEDVQDPDGVLSRQTTRVYDALNRLQQITGRMQ